jgi:hypothetical protein
MGNIYTSGFTFTLPIKTTDKVVFTQQTDGNTVNLIYSYKVNNNETIAGVAASRNIKDQNFKINPNINKNIFYVDKLDAALKSREVKTLLDKSFTETAYDQNRNKVESTDPRVQNALLIPKQAIAEINSIDIPYEKGAAPRVNFEDLVYPQKMSNQDYILFNILRYNKRKISTTNLFTFDTRYDAQKSLDQLTDSNNQKLLLKGSIRLPIQSGISDSNSVAWNEDKMNILELGAAGISNALQEGTGINELLDGMIGETKDNGERQVLEGFKQSIISWAARRASNPGSDTDSFFSRISGAIYNPNLELLFNGPNLRSFNFTFRMTPRSKEEGIIVRKIIRTFKQTSAVQRGVGDIFLKAPFVYSIKYIYVDGKNNSSEHSAINRIKICALQNMTVNYIPDGTYMTYDDSTMTCYELTLSFTELEPIYADDYRNRLNNYNIKNNDIGF